MNESIAHIARQIKQAREAKGLSQRALSKKVGIPQSHISKIENGAVNLQLSSLIELTRVLGLELMLVPKERKKAAEVIVREAIGANNQAAAQRAVNQINKGFQSDSVVDLMRTIENAEKVVKKFQNDSDLQKQITDAVNQGIRFNDAINKNPDILRNMQKIFNVGHKFPNIPALNIPALKKIEDINIRLAHSPEIQKFSKYQLDDED